jgi:hypothetical protein
MLRELISDARRNPMSLINGYFIRAAVAVPFVIALGFATAAVTLTLVDRFGPVAAFWMVAGGFSMIGLAASHVVTVKRQEVAQKQSANQEFITGARAQTAAPTLIALLNALLSAPPTAENGPEVAKAAVRNIPLVVLLALLASVFWPSHRESAAERADAGLGEPNNMRPSTAPDSVAALATNEDEDRTAGQNLHATEKEARKPMSSTGHHVN